MNSTIVIVIAFAATLLIGMAIGFMIGLAKGMSLGAHFRSGRPVSALPWILCFIGSGIFLLVALGSSIYSIYFIANSAQTEAVVTEIVERRVFDLAREYVDLILQGEHLRAAELTCDEDLNEFRELWLSQFDRPAVVSDETLGEHFFGERSVLEKMTPAAAYAHWTEKMVEGFPSVTEGTPDATVQDVGRDAGDPQIWHALVEWINVNDIRVFAATVEIQQKDDELCVKIPGSLFRIWK